MKICYVGNINAVHTQRWAEAFALMGHDVHVVYMGGDENNITNLEKVGISVHLLNRRTSNNSDSMGYSKSPAISEKLRNSTRSIYMRLLKKMIVPLKMYLVNTKRLGNLLKGIQPDILHAWFLYDSGCMAALSGYRPLVVSSWGADVILDTPHESRPLWMLRWANRFSLKKADTITATSEYLAKETSKYARKRRTIHVVPFGIDCDMFNSKMKKNEKKTVTLGFAKHLLPKYGPDLLIEAFGVLAHKYPFLRLKMAGEGYMLRELERSIHIIDINDRVIFTGKIPHNEIPDFLSDVDIAVQPSRYNSETFGVAALEASAMEIPVVSTKVGGVPECVRDGETGILIEPNDAKILARAISFLIEHPQKREQMGEAGRNFVKARYCWKDNVSQMESIYINCMKKFKES